MHDITGKLSISVGSEYLNATNSIRAFGVCIVLYCLLWDIAYRRFIQERLPLRCTIDSGTFFIQ